MCRGLPQHRCGWLCGMPSPGHSVCCGCCGQAPLWASAGFGTRAGLFVPPQKRGGQSPAVPVPAGTVTKRCVLSPRYGHRQCSLPWLWALNPALVLSSATLQAAPHSPLGVPPAWHWLPGPMAPHIPLPPAYAPPNPARPGLANPTRAQCATQGHSPVPAAAARKKRGGGWSVSLVLINTSGPPSTGTINYVTSLAKPRWAQ